MFNIVFLNNVKVFTVMFDEFNASFLNKSIHLFKKTSTDPNFWMVV